MREQVRAAILESGVVGIVRAEGAKVAFAQASALLTAGLQVVEISLVTPQALEAISAARGLGTGYVGAGTVLDESSAQAAISAGAQFIVAPTLNKHVVRYALRHGVTVLPGVATPTEALRAIELGADFAKLFPASAWGPGAIRDMLVALPQIPLVPTGGIGLDDVPAYISAGSVAVGLGSALSVGSPDEIKKRVEELLKSIRAARQRS